MQSLNDDMDELFRSAADEYPLNTNGADWNKVLQGLHRKEGDGIDEEKKKKDYKFLWLLLLLPIGFVCGRYSGNNKYSNDFRSKKEVNKTAAPGQKASVPAANSSLSSAVGKDSKKAIDGKVAESRSANNQADNRSAGTPAVDIGSLTDNDKADVATNAATQNSFNGRSARSNAPDHESAVSRRKTTVGSSPASNTAEATNDITSGTNGSTVTANSMRDRQVESSEQKATANAQTPEVKEATPQVDTAREMNNKVATVATPEKAKEKSSKQTSFKIPFSYSLLLGPDVSTIKMQKTSDVGYSIGVMLRYGFANRISVEAGVLWDRKNYYTAGKYVDTTGLKLPRHSIVKDASGYCNMIEIPVNIRYDFSVKQNHSWFASAGLSSYLMKNEDYDISYEQYSQSYAGDYGYMNSTKDWFSIMNLSFGYQKALGKKTSFSIAPYVKLPLRGIGQARLPISSTGIHLSFSRSLK